MEESTTKNKLPKVRYNATNYVLRPYEKQDRCLRCAFYYQQKICDRVPCTTEECGIQGYYYIKKVRVY